MANKDNKKELQEKFSKLDEKEQKKLMTLMEHQKKEQDLKALEYDYLKQKTAFKEIPFKSNTPEGEMVSNLDNFQYLMQHTRLSSVETNALYRYMTMVKRGVYPQMDLEETYMALKISEAGKGRQEKVSIVTGSRQNRVDNNSFFQKLFKNRKLEVEDGEK